MSAAAPHPALGLAIAAALCTWALPAPAAVQALWELSPYRVRVFVACEDAPPLTEAICTEVQGTLQERIEVLVGSCWSATVTPAPWELSLAMLRGMETLDTDDLPAESLQNDKVILIGLRADSFGYHLQGRELDCRTRLWGTTVSRDIFQPALLATTEVLLAAFAPLAQVEKVDGKLVGLRLRAGGLPPRDPQAFEIRPGTLFRPVIRTNDRDGNIRSDRPPQVIPWTILLAREADETMVQCEVFTGLRNPLSARPRGRTEQLAVAVKAPEQGTRLVVHSRVDRQQLLAGYEVYGYSPDNPASTLLGRTDIQGSLWIEPVEHPLRMLVIKSGGEFLARLPLIPGVEPEAYAGVADDDDRLAVEGYITGLQEEIVDLVAQRVMLIARIRARLEEGKLQEAQQLLNELRRLRSREDLAVVLNEQRRKYFSSDLVVRSKVDKLFNDTREVMVRSLDPRPIDQVAAEVDQAVKSRPAGAAPAPPKTGAADGSVVR